MANLLLYLCLLVACASQEELFYQLGVVFCKDEDCETGCRSGRYMPVSRDLCPIQPESGWKYSSKHFRDPLYSSTCHRFRAWDRAINTYVNGQIADNCHTGEFMSFWEGQCFTVRGWEFEQKMGEKIGSFMYNCTQVFPDGVDDDSLRSVGSNAEADNASGEWYIYVIG